MGLRRGRVTQQPRRAQQQDGRCLTSCSGPQCLQQHYGPFLGLPGSFLAWVIQARDSTYLECRPSPHLLFLLLDISTFPPVFYDLFSSWDGLFCSSCFQLLRRLWAGAAQSEAHKALTEQPRRWYKPDVFQA